MIILPSITLNQYLALEDKTEYNFAMKYAIVFVEAVDEYKVGDVMELPFGIIKDMQYDLEQGLSFIKLTEHIADATKIKDLANEPIEKICRFGSYLTKAIEDISDYENKTLVSEPEQDDIDAGLERFGSLGIYMQIRSLAGGDITKYEAVRTLPYSLCFTEMYTSKQISDFEKAKANLLKNRTHDSH